MRRRALLLSYYFPPIGGGGVTRTLRAARALAGAGWQPWVITVDDAAWSRDPSRLAEVPPGTRVLRLPNPDWGRVAGLRGAARAGGGPAASPGRLRRWLVPDLHVAWSAAAGLAASLAAAVRSIDVVYATAPPYSALLAGRVAGALGVPWIADFRDGWTCCPTRRDLPAWRGPVERRLERAVLERADYVLFASPAVHQRQLRRIDGLAQRSETLLTGFDPGAPPASCAPGPRGHRLELVHAGSLLGARREQTLRRFLDALRTWIARDPRRRDALRVRLLGAEPAIREQLVAAGLDDMVSWAPGVPRAALRGALQAAHGALVLQPPGPRGGDPVPGKLFDAAGAARPVFVLAREGALTRLVRHLDLGVALDPDDAEGIGRALSAALARVRAGEAMHPLRTSRLRVLSGAHFASRVVAVCQELAAAKEAGCPSPSAS